MNDLQNNNDEFGGYSLAVLSEVYFLWECSYSKDFSDKEAKMLRKLLNKHGDEVLFYARRNFGKGELKL